MIAEMREPKSTKVLALCGLPSWTPRPSELPPWKRATMGLMMLVVNAVIRPLKASATTSPTAMTMTSPRKRKFLKPRNMLSSDSLPRTAPGMADTMPRRGLAGPPDQAVTAPGRDQTRHDSGDHDRAQGFPRI